MIYVAVFLALIVGYMLGGRNAYRRLERCERMAKELWKKHVNEDPD